MAAGVLLAGSSLVTGTAGASPAARTSLPDSQPGFARTQHPGSAAAADGNVNFRVYLALSDPQGAEQTALAVSTPGSATYRQFLTPQQWDQRFAPKASAVAAVQQWLRSQGFDVVSTPSDGAFVAAEGTVAQVESAFGTTLGMYSTSQGVLRAPESAPSVPASLGGIVSAVVGLDDTPLLVAPDATPDKSHGAPSNGFRVGQPCSTWYGQKTVAAPAAYGRNQQVLAPCGYTPKQVEGLYGLNADYAAGNDGSGQTVAFVGANASPTLVSDVTTYSQRHGLPAPDITQVVAPGVYQHPDTPRQSPGAFYGEETLDAEAIHTTAPGAKLLFVGSSNAGQDFDASINHIVDKHLSSIISISYGFVGENVPQGYINSLEDTFTQAAATGIGVFVSSGDGGDEASTLGHPAVDFYADSPMVTGVGGTSAAIVPAGTSTDPNAPGWTRGFEVGWQTGLDPIAIGNQTTFPTDESGSLGSGHYKLPLPGVFQAGGGGGVSTVFAQPAYQKGVTDSYSTTGRAVPDIAALADPTTGLLVGQTQTFPDGTYYDEYRIGGTSVAAPLTAGIAALVNQAAGSPLGFLNPAIYHLYRTAPSALYDVDQQDLFCGGHACTTSDPLPAMVRVNYVNNVDSSAGYSYSLRTQETPNQTLHSVKGYDTATGVGSPGAGFVDQLAAGA